MKWKNGHPLHSFLFWVLIYKTVEKKRQNHQQRSFFPLLMQSKTTKKIARHPWSFHAEIFAHAATQHYSYTPWWHHTLLTLLIYILMVPNSLLVVSETCQIPVSMLNCISASDWHLISTTGSKVEFCLHRDVQKQGTPCHVQIKCNSCCMVGTVLTKTVYHKDHGQK